MRFSFEQYELDSLNCRVSREGVLLQTEPQVFDLLYYLVSHHGRLISRDELLEQVWKGKVISDTTLSGHIKSARKLLNDDGQKQQMIKTIHGRGYEFVSVVTQFTDLKNPIDRPIPLDLSHQGPLVVVLPFHNISAEPQQAYFAQGMSEDITTELSRFSDIQVVANQSASRLRDAAEGFSELSDMLNLGYWVEGSVRRCEQRIRINVQLFDAINRHQLWAEKYERPISDIFKIQDEIVEIVVSTISGQIQRVETARATARSTQNLGAYDHLLRGLSFHKNGYTSQDNFRRASQEFTKAIELDPSFARARAWLICSTANMWQKMTESKIADALIQAKSALSLDPTESEIHRILGAIYSWTRNFELSGYHYHEARRLSPNDAHIAIKMARYFAFTDQLEQALQLAQRAMFLNPFHPGWYWQELGVVYYSMGQFEQALVAFNRNWELGAYDLAFIAACHVAKGDVEKAKACCQLALAKAPHSSVALFTQFENYQDIIKCQQLSQQMLDAGFPD